MTLGQGLTAASIALFVVVHVFGAKLDFLSAKPRSIWLSAAGGVSVAYVFAHLLPELAAHQEAFGQGAGRGGGILGALDRHVYLIAMVGLVVFHGVERFAGPAGGARSGRDRIATPLLAFWLHLSAFAIYNVLIGYLLVHRDEADLRGLVIYAVAMGVHFVVNDHGLRERHGDAYHRRGRWLLAAAPVLGFLIGIGTEVAPQLPASLFALLAGGVILNVLKEELPHDRQSRFSAFAAGAVLFAALWAGTA